MAMGERLKSFARPFLLIVALLACPGACTAQLSGITGNAAPESHSDAAIAGDEAVVAGRSLHGRAVSLNGTAAPGAVVRLFRAGPAAGDRDTNPVASTVAGAGGYFSFEHIPDGTYNVEIAFSRDTVAFVPGILLSGGKSKEVGDVTLTAPGSIVGRVGASEGVTDLRGVEVYIPGSSFFARTDESGGFLLGGIPAGTYELAAQSDALGQAFAHDLTVRSGLATQAPRLQLSTAGPEIGTVAPAAGGPETLVRIGGRHFGATTGAALEVAFNGTRAATIERRDDDTIWVRVPPGARSGGVVVKVGGVPSNAALFSVVTSLRMNPTEILLLAGGTRSVAVSALDSAGTAVPGPELAWQLDSSVGTAEGSVIKGERPGTGLLTVSSGIVVATASVRVFGGMVASVVLEPARLVLGDREGIASARFASANLMSDGATNDLVALTVSDPASVSLEAGGLVTVAEADRNGTVTVTATSRLDATKVAIATIVLHNVAMVSTLVPDCQCTSIVSDLDGNLVFDGPGNRISYRPAGGGAIRTLVGTGETGFGDGPGLQATFGSISGLAASPGTVYPLSILDGGNYAIRVAGGSLAAPQVYTLAGGNRGDQDGFQGAAQFLCPTDLALGPDGSAYVADTCIDRIRKVDLSGEVSTAAGTGFGSYRDGPASEAWFREARGVSVAADGAIYVADAGNRVIRRIRDGIVDTYAGKSGYYDPKDGYRSDARFALPQRVFAAPDGNVYVSDGGTLVRVISAAGFVETLAGKVSVPADQDGPGPVARFRSIGGFAMDGSGNLYVADGGKVRIIVP